MCRDATSPRSVSRMSRQHRHVGHETSNGSMILLDKNPSFDSKPKVVILSYSNVLKEHEILSNLTLQQMVRCNHQTYASSHGYDYKSPKFSSTEWEASRFILNGIRYKTFSILSHMGHYDIVVWIDHDAVFYNMDMTVEHWLNFMQEESEILMAEDLARFGYKFNTGLQIIKVTDWTKTFYSKAVDGLLKTDVEARYADQPVLYKLHDSEPGAKSKLQIYKPRNDFQAFLKIADEVHERSWVVHATQCGCDLGRYIKPSQCRSL